MWGNTDWAGRKLTTEEAAVERPPTAGDRAPSEPPGGHEKPLHIQKGDVLIVRKVNAFVRFTLEEDEACTVNFDLYRNTMASKHRVVYCAAATVIK